MQMRCDFGITNRVDQIEAAAAVNLVNKMISDETSGVVNSGHRYSPRADLNQVLKEKVLDNSSVNILGDIESLQHITDNQAEIIRLILDGISEVTMDVPGLSSKCALVREEEENENSIQSVLAAADVLKLIN